jgi:hypothetical protein
MEFHQRSDCYLNGVIQYFVKHPKNWALSLINYYLPNLELANYETSPNNLKDALRANY